MNYKYMFFGDNEAKMLEFIDSHWDRVINAGHTTSMENAETFEVPGYYVRYSKAAVPSANTRITRSKISS